MLAKPNRIVKEKDFEKIFKQGQPCYTKLLSVKSSANQLGINRFGVVISFKVSHKATKRNRLKRQLRQIVKEQNKKLAQGFDIVIAARPGLLSQEYRTIQGELEKIFTKLKLWP